MSMELWQSGVLLPWEEQMERERWGGERSEHYTAFEVSDQAIPE